MSILGCLLDPFIESFNHKSHLHDLVKNKPIPVCIATEKGKYYLVVKNGQARKVDQKLIADQADLVTITAEFFTATELLAGRIKLRRAQAQKLLTISGSLRTSLLLETVFYLTRQKLYQTIDSEKLKNIY